MCIEDRRDPQPLIDPRHDAAAIRHYLLDELIHARINSRGPLHSDKDPLRPKRRHNHDKVRQWLTTLAAEFSDTGTIDWRWW